MKSFLFLKLQDLQVAFSGHTGNDKFKNAMQLRCVNSTEIWDKIQKLGKSALHSQINGSGTTTLQLSGLAGDRYTRLV